MIVFSIVIISVNILQENPKNLLRVLPLIQEVEILVAAVRIVYSLISQLGNMQLK